MAHPPVAETGGISFALELEREAGKAKLAEEVERLLSEPESERAIILLAGGSCSGKTTAAQELQERFGDDVLLISTDSYYHGRSWMRDHLPSEHLDNFDHPDAVELHRLAADLVALREGRPVAIPNYQFDTSERADRVPVGPRPIIVVEGLHALSEPLRAIDPDYRVFFEASRHGTFVRRLKREIGGTERDTSETVEEIVARIVHSVQPMYEEHVAPTREHADLVVLNDYRTEESAELPRRRHQLKIGCPDEFQLPSSFRTGRAVTQADHYFFSPEMSDGRETFRLRVEGTGPERVTTLMYRVSDRKRFGLFRGELAATVTDDISGLLERMYGSRLLVEKQRVEYALPSLEGRKVHIDTDVQVRANGHRLGLGTFAEFGSSFEITPVEALGLERSLGRGPEDVVNQSYYQLARRALTL